MMGRVLKCRGINEQAILLMLYALSASLMVKISRHILGNSIDCRTGLNTAAATCEACLK